MSLRLLLSCCLFVVLMGCGSGTSSDAPPRRIVSGAITYDGKPLSTGTIRFLPQPQGPVASALIVDGKYEVTNKGGVPVGEVKVEINGNGGADSLTQDQLDAGQTTSGIALPAKYNTQTVLTETISQESGSQVLNFTLSK